MTKETRHRALPTEELRRSKCDREAFAQKPRLPIMVVLDGVKQAYNVGAIFRLCDATLAERLVVCGSQINQRKRRLAQAAIGTQYWVPWQQADSAEEVVLRARAEGYQIIAAEQTSNSIRLEEFVPTFPVCLVFGGESDGVSAEVLRLVDAAIELPMRGMANSINVSTAAAIVLYSLSLRAENEATSGVVASPPR